ncbi:MAG: RHS repeat-associated core domain-containing protein [Calditrichia bacterium]|nr:RHS repeat-associated core domain-containing protein [Calditrichia bacterium]
MNGRSSNFANQNDLYKYSGKERDFEANIQWYYFGARYYDPEIGRWMSVDPLAEKHPDWSPYNYVLNNPLVFIDPDGRQVRADSYGNYDQKPFIKASQARLKNFGHSDILGNQYVKQSFVDVSNKYGPMTLDIFSAMATGFGQFEVALPLSFISTVWTAELSQKYQNPDIIVSLSTDLLQIIGPKYLELPSAIGQVFYDITLSGSDNRSDRNEPSGIAIPDNTKTNRSFEADYQIDEENKVRQMNLKRMMENFYDPSSELIRMMTFD